MDTRNIAGQLLTGEQKKHYDSVRWLIGDGPRATGRTRVLASAIIDEALSSGNRVKVHDHDIFLNRMSGAGHILKEINQIADILKNHIKIEILKTYSTVYVKARMI